MSSTTVKCNTCNVVINETLAFVQNKIDVMDEESLARICITSFSTDEISIAKKLLFESAPSSKRKVTRRGTGKNERDLYDIITLLKETDPEKVPIFVARELQKLPPVTFDHVDATRLLKDILLIQNELKNYREAYVTKDQFNEIKEEIETLKTSLISHTNSNNINNSLSKVSNKNIHYHSKSQELPHIVVEEKATDKSAELCLSPSLEPDVCSNISLENFVDACTSIPHVQARTVVSNAEAGGAQVPTQAAVGLKSVSNESLEGIRIPTSYAAAARLAMSTPHKIKSLAVLETKKDEEQNEGWILAQKKKSLRDRFIGNQGRANIDCIAKFKAADIKIPLFINNVDQNASANDIHIYIMEKTKINVQIEKIIMRKQKDYDAYKIFVPRHKLHLFLDDNLWPEGIAFRRYIDFKKRAEEYHKNISNGLRQ